MVNTINKQSKNNNRTPKLSPIKDALSLSQQINEISEMTGFPKKEVKEILAAQENLIQRSLKKGAVGEIKLTCGLKLQVRTKAASKSRKGLNPFTGEEMIFKAKPAQRVVKIKALKKLKDYVS